MLLSVSNLGDFAISNLDLYDVIQLCESLGVRQCVEELCAVAGILIATQPRNILEIGV